MTRIREVTHVDHLARALTGLQDARNALALIDLRRQTRSQREIIKVSRQDVDRAIDSVVSALRSDIGAVAG